jgi:hypothetical protein
MDRDCAACHVSGQKLPYCSQCKDTFYCSKNCQTKVFYWRKPFTKFVKDWAIHKKICVPPSLFLEKSIEDAFHLHQYADAEKVNPQIIKDFKDIIFNKKTPHTRIPKEGELADNFAECHADAFVFHFNLKYNSMIRSGKESLIYN